MQRDIFVNLDASNLSQGFVESFTQNIPAVNLPQFPRSDSSPIRLMFVRQNVDATADLPFRYIDPSGFSSVKFAGGIIGAKPDGGTFTITDTAASQTTAAIAYDASAATVQTAIRAALTTNFSTATVTGDAGGPYSIDRGTTGAIADITANAQSLAPDGSTVSIDNSQVGSAFLNARWNVSLNKAYPILVTSGWGPMPSAAVSVTVVQAGSATANKTFRVTWNADAYAGAVTLKFTGDTTEASIPPIAFSANADDVATAFANHPDVTAATNIAVIKNGPGDYTIGCIGDGIKLSNIPTLVEANNTLQVPVGLTAVCPVSTAGADDILGSASSASITIEVEVRESSGQPNTVAQATTKLLKDLIRNNPGNSTGNEDWATIGDVEAIAPHVFADSAARAADTPQFIGQLGFQIDTLSLWNSIGTVAGDWDGVFSILQLNIGIPGESAGSILIYETDGDFYSEIVSTGVTENRQLTLPNSDGTVAVTALTLDYKAKTSTYAIAASDCTIDCTSGTFTVTLPTAVGITGKVFNIKNSGAGTITVATTSAQTVDGTTPPSVTPGVNLTVQSTGANWIIL